MAWPSRSTATPTDWNWIGGGTGAPLSLAEHQPRRPFDPRTRPRALGRRHRPQRRYCERARAQRDEFPTIHAIPETAPSAYFDEGRLDHAQLFKAEGIQRRRRPQHGCGDASRLYCETPLRAENEGVHGLSRAFTGTVVSVRLGVHPRYHG